MERLETRLDGPMLIRPRVFRDERGFFHESYRRNVFAELGIPEEFVQDNQSRSSRGIVRGMHFQIGEGAAKLVVALAARYWTSSSTCGKAHPTTASGRPSS
jgi:dTDP-4-dehydrorhamnose 3,5-epimerase